MSSYKSAIKKLQSQYRTKNDIHAGLKRAGKSDFSALIIRVSELYLPPKSQCELGYLQDLLTGAKLYLKVDQVRVITAPKYQELSIRNLYNAVEDDKELLKYLPNPNKVHSKISKQFLWTVLDALRPDFAKQIAQHAR